ncbi:MAG: hypothetical protein ABIO78_00450 [Thermoanaerobaculia bacterium]
MAVTGHRIRLCILSFAVLFAAVPAFPQSDDRIQQLERKLEELLEQAGQLRKELDSLKGTTADTPQDLTAVEIAPPPEAVALTDVQTVVNPPSAATARGLNPDIAVIGTMVGHAGQQNFFESGTADELGASREPFQFEEAELAFEAFIDPYAKARFFIAAGPDGAEVEEAYAQFVTLPYGLTAKAGKIKALFGKANTWHTHMRPWVDQPLMVNSFFGGEGLSDSGISVSKTIANPWDAFIEATGEVYSGNAEGVFEREVSNDLFYNAHLKLFRDISENSNVEVGTSWARGTVAGAGSNRYAGVDVTYRWKPLSRSIYNSFTARFEGLANRRADFDNTLYGYYASADYQLARRWLAGVRIDSADRKFLFAEGLPETPQRFTDRGLSATLAFRPSEFSQLRGQFRRTSYDGLDTVNEFFIQLQFSIGAHGAHTF